MRAFLITYGLDQALGGEKAFLNKVSKVEKKTIMEKAHIATILNLGDQVL